MAQFTILEGGIYYFDANGNSPRKSWVDIEGERYYVDDNGIKQENVWLVYYIWGE